MSKGIRVRNSLRFLLWLAPLLLILLLLPLLINNPYHLGTAILLLVNIGMAVALRMVLTTGQFHVAHATFMGIGAYASALLVRDSGFTFWLALPATAVITGLFGLIIGYVTLRLKGIYFLIVTFSIGHIFALGIANGPASLGGYTGIASPPIDPITILNLLSIDFTSKIPYYYISVVLAALAVLIAYRMQLRYGTLFNSIEQNDALLESLGINVSYYKILAFVLACTIAGAIGSFWAHYFQIISPVSFGVWPSIYYLLYCQVGGLGSVGGAIIGATFFTFLHELLRPFAQYEPIVFGIILIISIHLLPGGLISLKDILFTWMNKGFRKREKNQNYVA